MIRYRRATAILAAILCIALLTACGVTSVPSDSSMTALFEMNREAFEQLREMAQDDYKSEGVDRIASTFVQAESSGLDDISWRFPAERLARYRSLFSQIETPDGLYASDGGVAVLVWASGFGGDGEYKMIVWSPEAPDGLSKTLDGADRLAGPVEAWRQLAPNWYIEYVKTY